MTITTTPIGAASPADVSVLLDGQECTIDSVSSTQIVCTTSSRPGLYARDTVVDIRVNGLGKLDLVDNTFRYVSLWSQTSTWGGQFAPVDGESVAVPEGLNLLVDIDSSPELNMVLVDGGSITFPSNPDPNHVRTFDAKVIFIRNGIFEAGTERDPYSSKLVITMHGKKYDPTVPIYGNKVLGGRYSTIDMHGIARDTAWTNLDSTVAAGATEITLVKTVDWRAGEKIMITSTSFERDEAEEVLISSATNVGGKTVLTL